jgi:hypothetical protein
MLSPTQLANFLESTTPKAERLRQSSPFLSVLEEVESSVASGTHAA